LNFSLIFIMGKVIFLKMWFLCYNLKIIEIGVAIILFADLEGIHVATRLKYGLKMIMNLIKLKYFMFKIFTSSIQLSIQLIYNYDSRLEILGSILKLFYFQYTHMLHHKHMLITIKQFDGNVQVQMMTRYCWFWNRIV
jgi:hypothetical protein